MIMIMHCDFAIMIMVMHFDYDNALCELRDSANENSRNLLTAHLPIRIGQINMKQICY